LKDNSGDDITNHDEKAKILWESFKDRLGKSEFNSMSFDLDNLLVNNLTINELEIPLSKQETDNMIAELPNNKSPCQDGFSNEFIKGYWYFLAIDYYKLFETLYEGEI
jgi:hypothetical protein